MTWARYDVHRLHRRTSWGWVTVEATREAGATSWRYLAEATLRDGSIAQTRDQHLEGAGIVKAREFAESLAQYVEALVTAARGGA